MSLLAVERLTVAYGAVRAVQEVSLAVAPGEAFAVLGANGAGKSSLVRTVLGWQPAAAGRVLLDGQDVSGRPPWRRAAAGLAAVPERGRVFVDLTVEENLRMGHYREGARPSRERVEEACAAFPVLLDRLRDRAGSLSGGQQQMLAIARALIARPRLLVIDELTAGLAPRLVEEVFSALARLHAGGLTLLIAEQNARRALEVSERALVLRRGREVLSGLSADLAADERVTEAYLGEG